MPAYNATFLNYLHTINIPQIPPHYKHPTNPLTEIKPESPKLIDNLKKIALIIQKEKKLQILFMKLFDDECTCVNARPITVSYTYLLVSLVNLIFIIQ